tara:strand:- start:5823 stop:7127 length:1305 start_codon:yes stop_codon:yes gene_type:complete
MADKDNKEIKKESSTKFGSWDNKYLRGGIAAILSYYAAKEHPYVLKGFSEKIDEFEKEDAETRKAFIEATSGSIAKVLAENRLKRKQRLEPIETKILDAKNAGLNSVYATKAYKDGSLSTLLKLKAKNPQLDLNSLFTVSKEYSGTIGDYNASDIASALVGPTVKLDIDYDKFKAPKRMSPITRLIGGDDDKSTTEDVESRVAALSPESDADAFDSSKIMQDVKNVYLSEKGQKALAAAQVPDKETVSQLRTNMAREIAPLLGVDVSVSGGEYIFPDKKQENKELAQNVMSQFEIEINKLKRADAVSENPNYYTRTQLLQQLKNKYFPIDENSGARKPIATGLFASYPQFTKPGGFKITTAEKTLKPKEELKLKEKQKQVKKNLNIAINTWNTTSYKSEDTKIKNKNSIIKEYEVKFKELGLSPALVAKQFGAN